MSPDRLDAAVDESSVTPFEVEEIALGKPAPAEAGSTFRHAIVLGLLTALGALGIDTYLPAFGSIAHTFGVHEDRVQLSLVSYFIALAAGQLFYGPLSDRFGRRGPLVFGFVLFSVASVLAAVSHSIEMLIAVRFFQGLGACAGMVIPRAIVRDLRSGEEAARLFALMLLVLGVSPILAPLIGSLMLEFMPWQAAFWFLAGFGVCCLALIVFAMEETNPPQRRSGGGVVNAFATYRRLAVDGAFLRVVLIGAMSQAVVFAYLAGSPFIYTTLHGVSPTVYSLLFALNAVCLIGSAQLNVRLIRRFGTPRLIFGAAGVQLMGAMMLLALTLTHWDTVPLIAVCLLFCIGAQGLLGPTTAMLALESNAAIAGSASAMMGAIQFACGALSSGLVSYFFDFTAVPFAAVILGCATGGFVIAVIVLRRPMTAIAAHASTDIAAPAIAE